MSTRERSLMHGHDPEPSGGASAGGGGEHAPAAHGRPGPGEVIVCLRCGHHNPAGTAFCANSDCGAFLEYYGKSARESEAPSVPPREPGAPKPTPPVSGDEHAAPSVWLSPARLPVDPGAEAVAALRIRNGGRIVDQFRVEVVGLPPAWVAVEPTVAGLMPGEESTVTLRFRPPRSPEAAAGPTPFRVRATSRDEPALASEARGSWTWRPSSHSRHG